MIEIILNDLEQLPRSAAVCIVGSSGRNSRLAKVLSVLRPDINITGSFQMANSDLFSTKDDLRSQSFRDALQVTDLVLTTLCKSRQYLQLHRFLGEGRGKGFLVVNPNFYHPFLSFDETDNAHIEKLRAARNLLPCAEDRSIYDLAFAVIQPRSNLQEVYFRLAELFSRMGRQYFDHVNASVTGNIIEGGVADGWVTLQLLGRFPRSTVYGFDPDSQVFHNSYHKPFLLSSGRFHFQPMGLWKKTDRVPFAVKKACTSSVKNEKGAITDEHIDTISIDEFVSRQDVRKVDFIKLDIEGSELSALEGARETILSHRPLLAVCIYHQLQHYYEIPFMLSEHTTDYVFRIGHYSPFHVFSETVLYAIPKELYTGH